MPGRIPKKYGAFNDYIENVNILINTLEPGGTTMRGLTLGMTALEITQAGTYLTSWHTGDPLHPGVYDLHHNPDTKTRKTRLDAEKLMKEFTVFFSPILTRMSGSQSITNGDRLVLNIKPPATTHRRSTSRIAAVCIADIEARPNGLFLIGVRSRSDSKRHSIDPDANAVELVFAVVEGKFKAGSELASKVKSICTGPDDGTQRMIYTRAIFNLQVDSTLTGFDVHAWVRWTDTHNPDRAGEWSERHIITIR